MNFNIAFRAGVAGAIGDAFASGEGLEDALFMHPSMLFQADEFDCIFNTLKYSKDNRAESINEKLLKCNAPRLSRAALRRSSQKMRISFSDRLLRRPILSYAAEALNHLSYS